MKTENEKKEDVKQEIEELLNSELEQVEGGACQCDSGAAQIVFKIPDGTTGSGIKDV